MQSRLVYIVNLHLYDCTSPTLFPTQTTKVTSSWKCFLMCCCFFPQPDSLSWQNRLHRNLRIWKEICSGAGNCEHKQLPPKLIKGIVCFVEQNSAVWLWDNDGLDKLEEPRKQPRCCEMPQMKVHTPALMVQCYIHLTSVKAAWLHFPLSDSVNVNGCPSLATNWRPVQYVVAQSLLG